LSWATPVVRRVIESDRTTCENETSQTSPKAENRMIIYPTPESLERHPVVPLDQWLIARTKLLEEEKEFTRLRDRINAQRRELPWVRVEKNYLFQSPEGPRTLANLFEGRSQLFVKHFMFAPGWNEGCSGCSFDVDHIEPALVHLEHHDVTCVAISRATLPEIEAFKQRMGWRIPWVSSYGSDFNYDYQVSYTKEEIAKGQAYHNYKMRDVEDEEMSGFSVFYKNAAGDVFHTYSTYGRGSEEIVSTYVCLDLTPKGRNETGPYFNLGDWVRHHDRYEDANV
jgi:predicted dithiol-disulfide oxidoreductase (DUF899 family)